MEELRFDGRVAIVTGGGRGIGRAHALLLAAKGAQVVVVDFGGELDGSGESTRPADDVVGEIRTSGGNAVACYGSVTEEKTARDAVEAALDSFGGIDVVVNNAGINDPAPFESLSMEQFQRMLSVHFFGTLHMTRAVLPHMKAADYGRVVCTVSEAMLGGVADQTSYSAAKGAVLGLVRSLATEVHGTGVRVNALAPRAFTRMSEAHAFAEMSREEIDAMQRILSPEQNSPAAVYLAHESCPLNGEILRAGMGSVARLAFVQTRGLAKEGLTAEDIAEHLDAILDVTSATITEAKPFAGA